MTDVAICCKRRCATIISARTHDILHEYPIRCCRRWIAEARERVVIKRDSKERRNELGELRGYLNAGSMEVAHGPQPHSSHKSKPSSRQDGGFDAKHPNSASHAANYKYNYDYTYDNNNNRRLSLPVQTLWCRDQRDGNMAETDVGRGSPPLHRPGGGSVSWVVHHIIMHLKRVD